jgi:DNA-binding NtrC family response regulator
VELQTLKQRFGILGNTAGINYVLQIATQVAPTDLSVLITGESGVGKEVFSKVIHQLSSRKHNNFIAVNCGAIPEGTIDSELFGHEKGSFTGAHESRKGYFETVNGGTIFLDEIAEMPLGTQARLLRVLETGEYIRVGSSKVLKTDVRVIAATNVNLKDSIAKGKFREDLYYRLNTVPIKVPALRERKEDILILFRKFCLDFADKYRRQPIHLDESAKQIILNYSFPGNIRELKNVAEQVSVLSSEREINASQLTRFMPDGKLDSFPMVMNPMNENSSNISFANEREMLYKLLFEMRKELSNVKQTLGTILQGNSVDFNFTTETNSANGNIDFRNLMNAENEGQTVLDMNSNQAQPIVLKEVPEVEETLNIAEKEKELIIKALKKYKGRRRNAAIELGISERTLYRKITEYGLDN